MKFPFIRIPADPNPAFPNRHSILRPNIPVRLINPDDRSKYFDFKAMIDSGADVSIFPGPIGEIIGLDIENKKILPIRGISGKEILTYLHKIILEIGGWKYPTSAFFCKDDITFPILGIDGFFNLFEVRL